MSNVEINPTETICAPPKDERLNIEVLEPRKVPLGGLRAMEVRRTLPQRSRSLIGAWCFLDHYGPNDVKTAGPMNVAAHPHTGLQTASWLFSGTIEHRDSAGNHAIVRPGELNLMTAGSGISHSERSTPDTTILHGVQLWIALPDRTRKTPKRFEYYAPPTTTGKGFTAKVFLGSLLGETSPVVADTPLVGAEIWLEPNASLGFAVDPSHEHGVLVDSGSVLFGCDTAETSEGTALEAQQLGYAPTGASKLSLAAGAEGARLVLIGGEPLGEEIVMWWNFIGRSHEEIVEAREQWQQTIAHSEAASLPETDMFGLPNDEPEPPLPAPEVPIARLKPRGHLPPLEDSPVRPVSMKEQQVNENTVTPQPQESIRVVHEADKDRYSIFVDDVLAGFTQYRSRPNGLAFIHTEISPEFGGRGLAGTLVSQALAEVRESGNKIIPYCPFVASWIKKHPEYEEITVWPTP